MKKRLSIKAIAALTIFTAFATITASAAWIIPVANIDKTKNPITGKTQGAYYAYGNGLLPTESQPNNRPYGITVPRHLYNFAWLQYLGFYNKPSDNGKQFYFELGDNIDMTGWVLPPIGTEENPFIGNFNGNGYVVKGLTISNNFSDYEYHPSDVTSSNFVQPHILGFIGVLGDYNDEFGSTAYSSAANTFKDTGLTGITIKTYVKDTLMGVAAGYAEAKMENVAVDASTITFDSSVTQTTTAYKTFTNISDYYLVGYTPNTKNVTKVDETIYNINTTSGHKFNATEQGQGATGWGGSIDMMSVTQRLQTIRDTKANQASNSNRYAYNRTYEVHNDEKDTDYTTVRYDDANTYTYNDYYEGHYQFITTDTNKTRYALLGGGHWESDKYYEDAPHAGRKITDGTNYLCLNSVTTGTSGNTNAGSIKNQVGDTENTATVWSVPTDSPGYISLEYYYNSDSDPVTYYLYAPNTTSVRLSTSTTYMTTWTREIDESGKIRYICSINGSTYYLRCNGNNWGLASSPNAPIPPDEPIEPEYPTPPDTPDYLTASSYSTSTYQISFAYDGVTYYLCPQSGGTLVTSTTPFTPGWTFQRKTSRNGSWSNNLPSATSFPNNYANARVYASVGGNTYYLTLSYNGGTASMSLTTTQTAIYGLTNNSGYRLASAASNNTRSYVAFNTGTLTFNASTTYNNLQFPTSRVAAQDYNSYLEDQYDFEYAAYEEALDSYDDDYEDYVKYRDQEYPGLLHDYEEQLATYNEQVGPTYTLNQTSNTTMTGPEEYLKETKSGMNYEDDDVTYFPLTTVNNTTDFSPSDTNTAYVVGGSNITSSTATWNENRTNVRFGYYPISDISSDFNSTSGTFTNIYTINDSTTNRPTSITNSTAYEKLSDAKTNLGGVMKGQTNVYGLHFLDASISMDAITTADYVKINKVPRENYELPVNSIDFNLKEFGYITFMSGSYFPGNSSETRNNSFFSLYLIERLDESPTKINRIMEIVEIYEAKSKNKSYSYVYQLKDISTNNVYYTKPYKVIDAEGHKEWIYDTSNSYSNNQYLSASEWATYSGDYTSKFKTSWIKKSSISSTYFDDHVFYFEIPMNDGEFCLGSVSGGSGCYLMYLDIGANASEYHRSIFYEHFSVTTKTYKHPEGVALKTLPTTIESETTYVPAEFDDGDSACVKISAGYKNSLTVDRTDADVAITNSSDNAPPVYAGEEITLVHATGSSTPLTIQAVTSSTKDIRRMTYYDYNVNLQTVMTTQITDVSTNGGTSYTRASIVQKIYSTNTATGTPTTTYTYDTATSVDQRSSMKVYNTSNGVRYTDANLINTSTLAIDTSKISSTEVLTVRLLQPDGSFTEDIVIVAEFGTNNQNLKIYTFQNYTITITPTGAAVTVKVINNTNGLTIYYGTTPAPATGQTITIPVPANP